MVSSRRSARKSRSTGYSGYNDPYEEDYGRLSRSSRRSARTDEEQEPFEEEEFDENDSSNGEVTRCICGNQELRLDPNDKYYNDEQVLGLFIQCDKCNVWQHGYCVSIYEDKQVPEKYWCERCRPDLHTIAVGSNGTFSRYIPVQPKKSNSTATGNNNGVTKKKPRPVRATRASGAENLELDLKSPTSKHGRTTMNSNDGLLAKVLRESAKEFKTKGTGSDDSAGEEIEGELQGGADGLEKEHRTKKSRKGSPDNLNEMPVKSEIADEVDEKKKLDEFEEPNDNNEDTNFHSPRKNDQEPHSSKRRSDDQTDDHGASRGTTHNPTALKPPRKKKAKSSSTSQSFSSTQRRSTKGANKDSTINGGTNGSNSILLNSDKPIEPRIPPPKISLHEMRKRITAISEFIYYVSVDLTEEEKSYQKLLDTFQQKAFGSSTSNSANTSLNTSLDEDDSQEEEKFIKNFQALFESNQNGSLEMIEQLRNKIGEWEENFGSYEA
ncbi:Cti6 protein [Saccharomycopsis crataegensis]|uniref:Cti6 protein n=1 Tax=Saccharomycopsis crataegensis TaxID=43959 RepID=A0AAV5QCL6_9ASCO|nr:Cti6 protein [Saccharomycopsis crataegensis]